MKYDILPIDRYVNAGPQYSVRMSEPAAVEEIRTKIYEYIKNTFDVDWGWRGKWKGPDEYFETPQLAIWFLEAGMIDSRSLSCLIKSCELTALDWTIHFESEIEDISGYIHEKEVIVFCDTKGARKFLKSKGAEWIRSPLQVPSF